MNFGYLLLAVHVLATISFGHIVKWSQRAGANLIMIGAVNYGVGALLAAAIALAGGSAWLTPPTIGLAAAAGLSYGVSYLIYLRAVRLIGVGITTAVTRLTVMPAVIASILFWGEQLSSARLVGLVIAILALPLLSLRPAPAGVSLVGPVWLLLSSLFLIVSVAPLAAKALQESGLQAAQPAYVAVWFGIACLVSLAAGLRQRLRPTRDDLVVGSALGVINAGGALAMLTALNWMPASVFFPISTAGSLLLAVVSSVWLWGERLSWTARAGVLLAAISLLIINL